MPSLKDLKKQDRQRQVDAKITKAMQMVAAAKTSPRPRSRGSRAALCRQDGGCRERFLQLRLQDRTLAPKLLAGTGSDKNPSAGRHDRRAGGCAVVQLIHREIGA